ncbi:MAG: bifunctional homocysteine S-methyltransferase/methylenetetrahydrofolate reductase [Candidatus Limnocylindrales bacterium]
MPVIQTPSLASLLGTSEVPGAAPAGVPGALTERERFRIRLRRRPLLLDGAMGTLLYSRGVPQRACLDELVLTRSDVVSTIHLEYLEAGADAIETNTFGANRFRLAEYGLEKLAGQLNRRAAQLAREARETSGREALVAGSIGPLGPTGRMATRPHPGLARVAFREQIEGLLEGGIDLIVLETFERLEMLLAAIEEARRACDLPVVALMTFGEDLVASDGTTPEAGAAALTDAGVDAVGVNCGAGPLVCLEALVRTGPPTATVARCIVPNAGLPRRIEGQFVYSAGPEYFGEMVPRMLAAGARIVGGCCGTTPQHTRAMRAAIDAMGSEEPGGGTVVAPQPGDESSPGQPDPAAGAAPRTPTAETAGSGDATPPSGLARKLTGDAFVISVEIDPPRSIRIDRTLEAARLLQEAGVDLVNISDSATGRVRMGSLAVAFGIQGALNLECLVHLTTRDRNVMALEAELLGAHALGVRNILALTGDPPRVADRPAATAVWDVDAIGLIEIIRRLNRGEDGAGGSIGQPAGFTIACALDPTAGDPDREWTRLERKLAAGANLIMTQPLYSPAQVEAMLARARGSFGQDGFPVPVLLGVLPLHSARHAEFLHNEVPGITIPDEQRAAMHAAGARGAEVGLEMAMNLLEQSKGQVKGTYIMPSFGRYELAAELVRRLRARQTSGKAG